MQRASETKLQTHVRVVRALIHREMISRFAKTSGGYFWAIAEPVAFILLLTALFSVVVRTPPLGDSFLLFFATGFMSFTFYRRTANFVSFSISANRALLNFPLVSPYDALISRGYLEAVTNGASALFIFVLIFAINSEIPDLRLSYLFIGFSAGVLLGFGVGMINAVLYILYPTYERVFAIINRPLMLISGVFFIPGLLPPAARDLVMWNPIAHVISLFRKGFFPTYEAAYVNYAYLFWFVLIVNAVGIYMVHVHRYTISDK